MAGCSSTSHSGDKPSAEYDRKTGHLSRVSFDYDQDGKTDSVAYMDGTRILRIELDLDENGKTERWDVYGPDRKLEKVGFASKDDGVMDSQAFYDAAGSLARIEISTRRDGVFDRTEFYVNGALTRSQDDTNHDGRPDKWDTYTRRRDVQPNQPEYGITTTAFDDSGSGRPERRFTYGPGGAVARVEIDPDGDGTFDPFTPLRASTVMPTKQ